MQTGKPRVILGLMTFGPDSSTGARITSLDEYNKCLDYLQSQGYNEVDTARSYVGGRVLPGKALRIIELQNPADSQQVSKSPSPQKHTGKNEA